VYYTISVIITIQGHERWSLSLQILPTLNDYLTLNTDSAQDSLVGRVVSP